MLLMLFSLWLETLCLSKCGCVCACEKNMNVNITMLRNVFLFTKIFYETNDVVGSKKNVLGAIEVYHKTRGILKH